MRMTERQRDQEFKQSIIDLQHPKFKKTIHTSL